MALPARAAEEELQREEGWQPHPPPWVNSDPLPRDEDREAPGQMHTAHWHLIFCVLVPLSSLPPPSPSPPPHVSLFYSSLEQTLKVSQIWKQPLESDIAQEMPCLRQDAEKKKENKEKK